MQIEPTQPGLKPKSLGVSDIVFFVIAAAAPLGATLGVGPVVFAMGGAGAPGSQTKERSDHRHHHLSAGTSGLRDLLHRRDGFGLAFRTLGSSLSGFPRLFLDKGVAL